jgi:hypothetical protein
MTMASWDLNGNSGTNPATNFLGTTDGQPLVIKTMLKGTVPQESLRIDSQGNVGIGTATASPAEKLEVNGNVLVAGGIGIGIGDHRDIGQHNNKLLVDGNLHMDGNPIYLRQGFADQYHGLAWYGGGKKFADADLDGPVLFGWRGGVLGATIGGQQKIALQWNGDGKGNVVINGVLDCGGPIHINADPGSGGALVLNDHDILLRKSDDQNHGIGFYGDSGNFAGSKQFAGNSINGPVLYGFHGGALGTMDGGQKIALQWNGDGKGNVVINGLLDCNDAVRIHSDLHINNGGDIYLDAADVAEDFDIVEQTVAPGTVMVLNEEGKLRESTEAYDTRVVGIVSGAGEYKPGIVLDKKGAESNRKSIALTGKVYCKVDADHAPINVGDLLTTSPTPGHAMKVSDSSRALGAVLGKALRPLASGQGLIPILVALQ